MTGRHEKRNYSQQIASSKRKRTKRTISIESYERISKIITIIQNNYAKNTHQIIVETHHINTLLCDITAKWNKQPNKHILINRTMTAYTTTHEDIIQHTSQENALSRIKTQPRLKVVYINRIRLVSIAANN
jgi:hypothetical protein